MVLEVVGTSNELWAEMDAVLVKIFAVALTFSQLSTEPEPRTSFDPTADQQRVIALLRAGCERMKRAFDVEAINIDDLIATAMDDPEAASGGHVAFMWYRAHFTMPAKLGAFDLTMPAVAVLNVLVDDYAEVWVNGDVPRKAGYPAPATIQGHNIPNRVVLGTSVKAGDKFEVAVFGINGPISVAPANTVWFRQARMEFFR